MLPETAAWQWLLVALALGCFALLFGKTSSETTSHSQQGLQQWRDWVCVAAWLCAGVLTGIGYAQHRAEVRLADALPRAWEGRDVLLVGAIASLPNITERGTRFLVDVEDVLTPEAVAPKTLSLTWYAELDRRTGVETPPPRLLPGERWHFTVRLRRPHGSANPHGFDFSAWALERNIRATGYVRARGINQQLAAPAGGISNEINRLRERIRARMLAVLGERPYAGVLVALVIGEQNAIPAAQWQTFWRTGTGHLMSISGLHITMVAALVYALVFRLWGRLTRLVARVPAQRVAAVAGAVSALAYSLIAGFSVPTQRTFFMLLVVALALLWGRRLAPSVILAAALFAVTLLDPWCVLAPGFWLSFGAVAMIFFVSTKRIVAAGFWRAALMTQLAVTLGLLPLTLALFQEVSVISPLANALAIPVVSWLVVPISLLGALLPLDLLLPLAHLIMEGTYAALAWCAQLPNAVWQSHAPLPWTVALACAGVVWVLMPRGVPMRWLGAAALVPMFAVLPPAPKPGELWVTLLDVGQGLAMVVRTANYALVYDAGPRWNPDADSGNRVVVPYLRGEGVRKLDALIITHDDEDHSGGAQSIIAARRPSWLLSSAPLDKPDFANAPEKMRCERGDGWRWDGVEFDVLHPPEIAYEEQRKTNNLGCVLKITAPGGTLLLPADIERVVEAELLAAHESGEVDLRADVLVMPHHGSKTSSTEVFIDAVQPRFALLPVGYRNRFRHPHPDVALRYSQRGIPVLRTDWDGAITLRFTTDAAGKPQVTRHREAYRRYWTEQIERSDDVTAPRD